MARSGRSVDGALIRSLRVSAMKTYTNPVYAYRRSPDSTARRAAARGRRRRRAGRARRGDRPRAARRSGRRARRRQHGERRLARDLLREARAGDPRPAGLRRARSCSKGVGWNVGKVFFRDELVYAFDLLPETGHRRPAFVNLQQYYLEEIPGRPARRAAGGGDPLGEQGRRRHAARATTSRVRVDTPDGEYGLACDWLIVCDGSRSPVRTMLGPRSGRSGVPRPLPDRRHPHEVGFPDGALVLVRSAVPSEPVGAAAPAGRRRLARSTSSWAGTPIPRRRSKPERILPRLRAMLGEKAEFDIEWASVYTFQCRRMQRFRHGRVLFAGDAAHVVSPFGARGANSGFQDADNLVWKLRARAATGCAPERLLDTYDAERVAAADENILNSTRATDFITPKSPVSRTFRDAVLALAKQHAFARRLVNSGRLSVPSILADSPLNTPDRAGERFGRARWFRARPRPTRRSRARPAMAARLPRRRLHAARVRRCRADRRSRRALARDPIPCRVVQVGGRRADGRRRRARQGAGSLGERYDAQARDRATCCGPTSTSARAGAASTPTRVRAAIARATVQRLRQRSRHGHAQHRTRTCRRPTISTRT